MFIALRLWFDPVELDGDRLGRREGLFAVVICTSSDYLAAPSTGNRLVWFSYCYAGLAQAARILYAATGLVGSISLAGIAHMNSSPTRAQVLFVVTLICGIACLALAAIASGILAGGWMLNWLIPSLAFEHASIVAGTALTIATILMYGVANIISEHILQKQKIEEEHDDDDDYSFDEEMAERIAELTIAKLNRGPAAKKYSAKARQK